MMAQPDDVARPPTPVRAHTSALVQALRVNASRDPRRTALQMISGPPMSYAELNDSSARLAVALLAIGLQSGDRVAVWTGNEVAHLVTYLACAQAGLVVVPVNVRFTVREATELLEDSGARVLVHGAETAGLVESSGAADQLTAVISTMGEPVPGGLAMSTLLASRPATRLPAPPEDALLVLAYTSGTSGKPKGAQLTHRSVAALGRTNALACRYRLGSTQVFTLSLSFSATVPAHVLPHMWVGGTTVLLPGWETEAVVDAIEATSADFLIVPSPPLRDFARAIASRPERVASVNTVLHSASKVPGSHLGELVDVLGPRVVEGWGMTENSGGLFTALTERDLGLDGAARARVLDSVGRPVPETQVALLDDDGRPLPHDGQSTGHLLVESPTLAAGYWRRPDATAAAFPSPGRFATGDMGFIDPDGLVHIVERRTDLIVSGGMNIYPSELERVLYEIPGISECAVVAAPHERWGQTPVAYVVRQGDDIDESAIQDHCGQRLASFKRLSAIRFVEELPHNASSKVLRRELRDREQRRETAPDEERPACR
jgi:fatty-acyl-CoA synthase